MSDSSSSRDWWFQGYSITTDHPAKPMARSLAWMCMTCATRYAVVKSWINGRLQPYQFIHGCCPHCEGNKFLIPGSLECVTLVGWAIPIEVLAYQLEYELQFLDSPHHPHNQESSL